MGEARYFKTEKSGAEVYKAALDVLAHPERWGPGGERDKILAQASALAVVRSSGQAGAVEEEVMGLYEMITSALVDLAMARMIMRGEMDVKWDPKLKELRFYPPG